MMSNAQIRPRNAATNPTTAHTALHPPNNAKTAPIHMPITQATMRTPTAVPLTAPLHPIRIRYPLVVLPPVTPQPFPVSFGARRRSTTPKAWRATRFGSTASQRGWKGPRSRSTRRATRGRRRSIGGSDSASRCGYPLREAPVGAAPLSAILNPMPLWNRIQSPIRASGR